MPNAARLILSYNDPDKVEAELAAFADKAVPAWLRAVGRVTTLAGQIQQMDSAVSAVNANLEAAGSERRLAKPSALLDPPLTVGDALWAAILAAPPPKET